MGVSPVTRYTSSVRKSAWPLSLAWLAAVLVIGCGKQVTGGNSRTTTASSANLQATALADLFPATCQPPTGVSNNPTTIDELVHLLNALPKPTTISCLLDVLPHPLGVKPVLSTLSVQPAVSEDNPRIFVAIGPLTMAFVPDGPNQNVLEITETISGQNSIKSTLIFPLKAVVPASLPYKLVLADSTHQSTACLGCHHHEIKVRDVDGVPVYASFRLRPDDFTILPNPAILNVARACTDRTSERCRLLNATYRGGTYTEITYATETPYFGQ